MRRWNVFTVLYSIEIHLLRKNYENSFVSLTLALKDFPLVFKILYKLYFPSAILNQSLWPTRLMEIHLWMDIKMVFRQKFWKFANMPSKCTFMHVSKPVLSQNHRNIGQYKMDYPTLNRTATLCHIQATEHSLTENLKRKILFVAAAIWSLNALLVYASGKHRVLII